MKRSSILLMSLVLLWPAWGLAAPSAQERAMLGGETTIFAKGRNAFSLPAANMPMLKTLDFSVGNSFFRNPWVSAPSTTKKRDGLGALFNTNGCQNCHIRDGRGHAPTGQEPAVSMLVRLSIPDGDKALPEPMYGGQLQDFAIPGVPPEGQIDIRYEYFDVELGDETKVTLRRPLLQIKDLGYGALHEKVQMSARIATPMIGLGLLESIPEEAIRARVDPLDANKDGISGRAQEVVDLSSGQHVLGRFGWKAGQPHVRQQNAAAFAGDLGITSTLFPKENCTAQQTACAKASTGGAPELDEDVLDAVTFYAKNLAVPSRRSLTDGKVVEGEAVFTEIGCARCHTSSFTTGPNDDMPWLAGQTIAPYTDLLLHDMGVGLADHRPEGEASGTEWRTPPLWGIGLTSVVNKEFNYLHDGRARTLLEAVLWHGGESKEVTETFKQLPSTKRAALIAFLKSL